MPLDPIAHDTVRGVLRALRKASPLKGSPLFELDQVTLLLSRDGIADTRASRSWALGRCIADTVDYQMETLRGVHHDPRANVTASLEIERLAQDLASESAERLDLALVHWRYLSPIRQPGRVVSHALGMSERTLRHRLSRGVDALVERLREQEVAASARLNAIGATRAHERIVADEGASTRSVSELLHELLSLVRADAGRMRIAPSQLAEMAGYPAAEVTGYRLGRIAEWSLPRYRLDSRFVTLTLLVDLGEESVSGRWREREERFSNLRDVLAAVGEPAVVILGPPGCGKSTLLRRLELDVAHDALGPGEEGEAPALTFFVSLNRYRPEVPGGYPPTPKDWLAARWAERFPSMPPLAEIAAASPMVFLLDGLNEMPHQSAEEYRQRIALWKQWLYESVSPASGHRAVIACRSLDYSAPLSTPAQRVPQVRIEPLTDEQVREFLRAYNPERGAEVWAAVDGTQQLEAIRAPFFVALLVDQVEATGNLSAHRAELFTSLVRQALRREVERDNPIFGHRDLLTDRDLRRLSLWRWRDGHELPDRGALVPKLEALAFEMQAGAAKGDQGQVRLDYDRALALMDHDRAEDIVRAGLATSILDEDPSTQELLYRHQLVQEYFAARHLAREPDPELVRVEWRAAAITPSVDEVIDSLDPADPLPPLPSTGWEETTVLAAAMADDPPTFLRAVAETNLRIAGRAAAQPELAARMPDELLDELRWALVKRSRDPEADLRDRIACGYAVGDLGDPRFERRVGPESPYLLPPMVAIAGGRYPIGDDEPVKWPNGVDTDHMPRHEVELAAFAIGRFTVTNAEWRCFMEADGYDDERWWDTEPGRAWRRGEGTAAGTHTEMRWFVERCRARPALMDEMFAAGTWDSEQYELGRKRVEMSAEELDAHFHELVPEGRHTEPAFWCDARFNGAAQPVVGICWHEARAYASWLSAQAGTSYRLPTEVEHEAATRGRTGRRHAYGDEFDRRRGNTVETHIRQPTPIGVFPNGETPECVCDLGGNVGEWTSSAYGDIHNAPKFAYPYDPGDGREVADGTPDRMRVLRGGTWLNSEILARAVVRYGISPSLRTSRYGFRLAFGSHP